MVEKNKLWIAGIIQIAKVARKVTNTQESNMCGYLMHGKEHPVAGHFVRKTL